MRVISQNGIFDFPYEQIAVYRNDSIVHCRFSNVEKSANVLGGYSSEEKAEKAMEMLMEAYTRIWDIECGNISATKKDSCIFQFPEDDEVKI